MEKLMQRTMLRQGELPNPNNIMQEQIQYAEALLPDVIAQSKQILTKSVDDYNDRITPRVIEELDNLEKLRQRHLDYQLSFNFAERRMDTETRKVNEKFNNFVKYVKDSLEIENNPYIRVIAAVTGIMK